MNIQTKGFAELKQLLQKYEKKVAKAAMRKAVRAGVTILKAAVKESTPVDKGLLKKAQDYKVTTRANNFAGIVGANVAALKEAQEANSNRPSNIDWLVENGHMTPDGTFVPPSGYMRRAADEAMPAAVNKMEQSLRSSIESMDESE